MTDTDSRMPVTEPSAAIAACTTLSAVGLVGLAKSAASAAGSGVVGGIADRTWQQLSRAVRDRLAGWRDAPEGAAVARGVRMAQLHALERLVREYEASLRVPRFLRSRSVSEFIDQARKFCATSVGWGVDFRGMLDVERALPTEAATDALLPELVGEATQADRSARLAAIAEAAVLDELRQVTQTATFPRGFEEHFRRGRRGCKGFLPLFRTYLEQQLRTNEDFYRVFTAEGIARIESAVAQTAATVAEMRADQRAGMPGASMLLAAGESLHFATTDSHLGRRLTGAPTFNHARPLAGREGLVVQLASEVRSLLAGPEAGVIAISAIGGAGKTRLLLEVARRLEHELHVRWVRDSIAINLPALAELPTGPLLLLCDDAHRRADLTELLALAQRRTDPTVVLVSTRPYGTGAVRTSLNLANIGYDRLSDFGEVPEVPLVELVPIVAEELGPEYQHAAERLLRLSGGSMLVALVAARLLRTRQLEPVAVLHDAEFQTTVLEGFRNEAVGALPGTVDQLAARRLLETLAAVQPLDLLDEEIEGALARFINLEVSTLRRTVAALEEGGVIRSGDGGSRIVPDVLADHILDTAMVASGRPTAIDTEILHALGARVLLPLLRNVAELDWRRQVANQPADIFPSIWSSFSEAFRAAPNWQRVEWLAQLDPVAALQPGAMIAFAEALIDDPRGDERDERAEGFAGGMFAVPTPDVAVVRKLPPLLGRAALHPDCTVSALTLLWRMGQDDVRDLGQQTDHPLRVLTDTASYSRRRHLWMQERALEALEVWLRDPAWSAHPQSPLAVAKAVLQTEVVEHAFNEREKVVTMTRVGVHPSNTRELRLRAIALLEREVMARGIRGRARALRVMLDALRRPGNA
ncbi:MAG: hypothetical protein MUF00_20790, partial [Gemmatimonadaceae bacterium]|nr:hypothetical protein [Gemmatimonadaceae bacterium]